MLCRSELQPAVPSGDRSNQARSILRLESSFRSELHPLFSGIDFGISPSVFPSASASGFRFPPLPRIGSGFRLLPFLRVRRGRGPIFSRFGSGWSRSSFLSRSSLPPFGFRPDLLGVRSGRSRNFPPCPHGLAPEGSSMCRALFEAARFAPAGLPAAAWRRLRQPPFASCRRADFLERNSGLGGSGCGLPSLSSVSGDRLDHGLMVLTDPESRKADSACG